MCDTPRSAVKDIKVGQVPKSRRCSSEPHDLSAAWAKRRAWHVFSGVFVAHGRERSLSRNVTLRQSGGSASASVSCRRPIAPDGGCPGVVGGNSRGPEAHGREGAIGRRPSWTRKGQALDPAAIAFRARTHFGRNESVPIPPPQCQRVDALFASAEP